MGYPKCEVRFELRRMDGNDAWFDIKCACGLESDGCAGGAGQTKWLDEARANFKSGSQLVSPRDLDYGRAGLFCIKGGKLVDPEFIPEVPDMPLETGGLFEH